MGLMVDTDTHMLVLMAHTFLAKDLPNHLPIMVMDTAVDMDMAVTDTVDTVERDPLNHTTDMVDTEDTEDTDMAVVMDTVMVVNPSKKQNASIIRSYQNDISSTFLSQDLIFHQSV